jgi:hypothetical protein
VVFRIGSHLGRFSIIVVYSRLWWGVFEKKGVFDTLNVYFILQLLYYYNYYSIERERESEREREREAGVGQ